MSKTKGSLIVLLTGILLLTVGGGSSYAQFSELNSTVMISDQYLGEELVISALDNEQVLPAAAYNSNHDEYLVVWQNTWPGNKDIYAQRINGRGELISWFAVGPTDEFNPYPNDRVQPSVAYDSINDRYLVVWAYDTDGNGNNWDIHGVMVDWDAPIQGLHQFIICDWSTQQLDPRVAYSETEEEFMIVWQTDHPSFPDYISGRRMKASDGTFPGNDSDFTISDTTDARIDPEIAFNQLQNEYLVVYDDTVDIYGSRFSATGAPQGGEFGIAAWPGEETLPSVAYCSKNDQYLVAWQNPQPDIYARFINADGSLDGGPLHMEYTGVDEVKPEVACNQGGNQFLVTWQQQFSNASGPYGIAGQFVNTDHALESAFGIMIPSSGISAEFTTPVVAGGKTNFLTAWEHDREGTSYQDIHGRLINMYEVYLPLITRNQP